MSTQKDEYVKPSELCPCGSGIIYKKCCKKKKFKWIKNDGDFLKQMPLDKDVVASLTEYKNWCEKIYGRKLQEDDKMFWGYMPTKYGETEIRLMRKANVPENRIYAFYQTGRILVDLDEKMLLGIEIKEYISYLDEYDT